MIRINALLDQLLFCINLRRRVMIYDAISHSFSMQRFIFMGIQWVMAQSRFWKKTALSRYLVSFCSQS